MEVRDLLKKTIKKFHLNKPHLLKPTLTNRQFEIGGIQ